MPYTRRLDELHRADEPSFGGKSASLGELLTAKIPVPPGFAISAEAYRAALRRAGIEDPTPEAIEAAQVPAAVRDEIAERYDELAKAHGKAEPPVAVRSSASRRGHRRGDVRRPAGDEAVGPWRGRRVRRRAQLLGEPLQPAGGQLPGAARAPRIRRWASPSR